MQKFPRRWTDKDKIDFLQRKVIINSIIYYELNTSKMTDREYDELSRQLVDMQKDYPDISNTQYGYVMYDFDGTTGFDLYNRLNDKDKAYLKNIAQHITGIGKKKETKKPSKVTKRRLF